MADAAYEILTSDATEVTGNTFIDEALLRDRGMRDFECYKNDPTCDRLQIDLFIDEEMTG